MIRIRRFYLVENKKFRINASDIVLTVLSVFFFIGMLTFLNPCGPKEDGSWMTCHWAGQALTGISAVLTVISIIHLCIQNTEIKQGLSLAMIPAALLSAVLPGTLISLCMMNSMRCHSVTRTASIIISAVIIIAAVIDIIICRKKKQQSGR